MTDLNYPNRNNIDGIDLFEIFKSFWEQRIFIIKITAVFFVIGIFIAFASLKEYKSEVKLLPEISSREGGASGLIRQFGSIGSLTGIDISGLSGFSAIDAISPKLYPEVIKSKPFLYQLLYTEVKIPSLDTVATIFNYLSDLRKKSVFEYLEKYTIGLPGTLMLLVRKDHLGIQLTELQNDELFVVTPEQDLILKELNSRLKSNVDQKTGIISISAEFPDAILAAQITDQAYKFLTDYITDYRLEKVNKNLNFIRELHSNSENDFKKAQNELAAYRDKNKNIISASVKSEEERLQAKYNLAFNVYNNLSQQLEQAKIKVQEETPVFKVLNPVQVMNKKSKPKRMLIMSVMIIAGVVVGMGITFFRHFYSSRLNE